MRSYALRALASLLCIAPVAAHATAYEASGFTWSGMFVGINAGYGTGTSDWDFSGGGSNSHTINGGVVGLQAGYNAQLASGLVAGVEISTEATDVGGNSGCSGGSCKSHVDSLSDISGRLGVNYDKALLYGKAGAAYGVFESTISNGAEARDKGGSVGFVLGGGAEFYVDNNITSSIEYNYYDFPSDTATVGTTHIKDSTSLSVVKAGLNLKFN